MVVIPNHFCSRRSGNTKSRSSTQFCLAEEVTPICFRSRRDNYICYRGGNTKI